MLSPIPGGTCPTLVRPGLGPSLRVRSPVRGRDGFVAPDGYVGYVGSQVAVSGRRLVPVARGRDDVLGEEVGGPERQPAEVSAPTVPGPPADYRGSGSGGPERPPQGL